jgi:hypothetical protein
VRKYQREIPWRGKQSSSLSGPTRWRNRASRRRSSDRRTWMDRVRFFVNVRKCESDDCEERPTELRIRCSSGWMRWMCAAHKMRGTRRWCPKKNAARAGVRTKWVRAKCNVHSHVADNRVLLWWCVVVVAVVVVVGGGCGGSGGEWW